jgi:multiple sugar transport system substrate-binding protein
MAAASAGGFNLGFESAKHKPNVKAGEVVNSGVIAELVQRVCLNNEDPKKTLAETAQKIEKMYKG